ncbi:MAG: autotransporter outer membrane beta-barrel domain-containing protein [Endomicrobia bacterium]|nr:autotransporter outer membrane beta-barrel domain-containing protein [Endomicrobiia bacterium]
MKKIILVLTTVMFCINAAFAGQTINISDSTIYHVNFFGNGDALNNGHWAPSAGFDLLDPNGNTVNISNLTTGFGGGGTVNGGYVTKEYYDLSASGVVTANSNRVHITSNSLITGLVYGGNAYILGGNYIKAIANNNSVTIEDSEAFHTVYGGHTVATNGDASANNNEVKITNGIVGKYMNTPGWGSYGNIYGGYATSSRGSVSANGNVVNITSTTFSNQIYGGYASTSWGDSAEANGNSVSITNMTLNDEVYGGYTFTTYGNTTVANNNSISITSSTINSTVYGGWANYKDSAASNYNTITISGTSNLNNAVLYGGFVGEWNGIGYDLSSTKDSWTGNTLNVKNSGMSVKGIYNFENLNFYLPETMTAGETMLNVADSVNISNSTIGVERSSDLNVGDTFTLINSASALVADGINTKVKGLEGVAKLYDIFDLSFDANNLYATYIYSEDRYLNPQTKILSEGVAAGAVMALQSADSIDVSEGVFFKMFGGNTEYETGSSVKANVFGLVAGIGKKFNSTTLGAFIEYASGSYDTEYDNVSGSGDASAVGGGIIAKKEISDYYVEGFVRAGQLTNEYKNKISGLNADFDYSTMYYGFSLAGGRVFNVGDKLSVDTSAKYSFTSIGGNDVVLPTNEKYEFDSVLSNIVTAEVAAEYEVSNWLTPYASLSYAYELSGDVNSKIDGFEIEAPSLNGGTFAVGLGASVKVIERLTIDLGVNVLSGVRNGTTGNLQVKFKF